VKTAYNITIILNQNLKIDNHSVKSMTKSKADLIRPDLPLVYEIFLFTFCLPTVPVPSRKQMILVLVVKKRLKKLFLYKQIWGFVNSNIISSLHETKKSTKNKKIFHFNYAKKQHESIRLWFTKSSRCELKIHVVFSNVHNCHQPVIVSFVVFFSLQ